MEGIFIVVPFILLLILSQKEFVTVSMYYHSNF